MGGGGARNDPGTGEISRDRDSSLGKVPRGGAKTELGKVKEMVEEYEKRVEDSSSSNSPSRGSGSRRSALKHKSGKISKFLPR